MDQKRINHEEWEDPDNWTGFSWFSAYASRRDTRWLVPKRRPRLGWTLNMAHPAGAFVLTGVLVAAVAGCCCLCAELLGV